MTKPTIPYESCTLFSADDSECPMCKVLVPALTFHECSGPEKEPAQDARKKEKAKQ